MLNIYCDWCIAPAVAEKKRQFIVTCSKKCGFIAKLSQDELEDYIVNHLIDK